jgi:hypothetical protein
MQASCLDASTIIALIGVNGSCFAITVGYGFDKLRAVHLFFDKAFKPYPI